MPTMRSQESSATPAALAAAAVDEILGVLNDVEQKNAPARLYFRGDRRLLQEGARVSIVGSRSATAEGLRRAGKLARALVARGVIVVSGLAEGIDTAAHEMAMQTGGRTIAVLGSPVDVPYPASNKALLESIGKDHLVISQFPPDTPIQPKNFPMRNRTMALLSHATIIVEAAEKSGTIHQAWEALRLGRPLFLLESIAKNPELTWPKEVQSYGAQVLSDSTFDEMLEQLPAGHYEGAVAF